VRTWLADRWLAVRVSYWFVPSLFAAGALGLAECGRLVDRWMTLQGLHPAWVYTGGPAGARALLTTLAGSMIGTAGVTFSVTIVALSLASSQFGPRLLRNFMRDRGNQVVLGTFVATFLYCILVLREVRDASSGAAYVPAVSVAGAVVLGAASLGILIYFFHHVASSIQASHVVAAVARDLVAAVDGFCARAASRTGSPEEPPAAVRDLLSAATAVEAKRSGYVRWVDHGALVALAAEHDALIETLHRAGDFVIDGGSLVRVVAPGPLDPSFADRARRAIGIGEERTEEQDVEYSIRQLVEVALRALSPGINDPHTAMTCVDWLGVALARLARHGMPPRFGTDDQGRIRLVTDTPRFEGVVGAAFDPIRQAAARNLAVSLRLLETLRALSRHVRSAEQAEVLRRQAESVFAGARAAAEVDADRAALEGRHEATVAALRAAGAGSDPA
jgi:uncharacterized membrane protein